jgi:serine/threonine protein kinase
MFEKNPCPGADQLQRLLNDELVGEAQRSLQAHLEGCATCQMALERLVAAGPSWDRAARNLGGNSEPTEPALKHAVAELQGTALSQRTPPSLPGEETQGEAVAPTSDEFSYLDPPAQPGHLGRLGSYEILDVVGRGGMGVVFKALDERLNRIVAVKVLGPQYAASSSARKRFEREARAAAAVSHDHVVPIYHVEETGGISYLVMPLIVGTSLQERVDCTGPLELKEILRIGSQIACGLAAAHKQGLVHRDIKPANILLENGVERVKITDFGLARAVDDASVTQSGVITGTPMFMSPEQARGEYAVDHRSDLFSLGSVLYVMCTGRLPFRASGTHAVVNRVINDTPRPMHEINPDVPDWLEAIVAKLHAKRPEDRFQSAQEVADHLNQHLAHLQEPRRALKPPPVEAPVVWSPGSAMQKLLDATDRRQRLTQHAGALAGLGVLALGALIILFSVANRAGEGVVFGVIMVVIGAFGCLIVSRVKQRWQVRHCGHTIRVENGWFRGEALYVDGVLVARGGLGTRTELRGVIRQGDGVGDEIMVLCEPRLLSFRCRIFVERQAVRVEPARRPRPRPAAVTWTKAAILIVGVLVLTGCGIFAVLFGGAILAMIGALFLAQGVNDMRHDQGLQVAAIQVPQAKPLPAPDGDWLQLFNNQDKENWIDLAGKGDWLVKDGVLVGNGGPRAGDAPPKHWHRLVTDRDDFADFHLRAEVQAPRGSESGICFRCSRDFFAPHKHAPGKLPPGYEARIGPLQAHKTGTLLMTTADRQGIPLMSVGEERVLADTWFTLEIVAKGNNLVVKIDDRKVVDCTDGNSTYKKGCIALQVRSPRLEHDPQALIHFRKIEIKNLTPPEGGPQVLHAQ